MLLMTATALDAGTFWTPRVLNCLSLGTKSLYISCFKQHSRRLATKEADNQFLTLLVKTFLGLVMPITAKLLKNKARLVFGG